MEAFLTQSLLYNKIAKTETAIIIMNEKSLVAKCKKQKQSAQFEVYQKYAPLLRGVCCRYIINKDEAEDVLQEGFFRIFTQIEKFTYTGENSFFYWMKRVVINHALNYLKKQKKERFDESFKDEHLFIADENSDDIFNTDYSKYTKENIISAVEMLPLPFRMVLNMAVIDGLKHKEIAGALSIAEETSRSRLTRAKQMLRKNLIEVNSRVSVNA